VMMLDINFAQLREGFQRYLPVGATIGVVLLVELALILTGWKFSPGASAFRFAPSNVPIENTALIGQLLYTDYILPFQASGLILLVAMIGAIVLTLRDRPEGRRQNIRVQVARTSVETLELVEVRTGAGINELGIRRPQVAEPEPVVEHDHAEHAGGHH
jgi:NADH-quinone oxidoreductase subunit J